MISPGNAKLGKIPSWSLPRSTCNQHAPCFKRGCYAATGNFAMSSVIQAYAENLNAVRRGFWFRDVSNYLNTKKPAFFRIHVSGDFRSQEYLNEWITLADSHPKTCFLAFTKKTNLDFTDLPPNFIVLFSAWPGWKFVLPPGLRRIAWMDDGKEDRVPANARRCPGSCENCKECWSLDEDIVFKKH